MYNKHFQQFTFYLFLATINDVERQQNVLMLLNIFTQLFVTHQKL